ncbi:hypothetical protein [Cellulophaga sp. BC115SP]|jgi:hypothetical protein|uniref:hypothetical protein n=1 Tax=Cellulophaga sp. BC115SP TaxID=2683263 RepID=UPI001412E8D7|nr:hypothetical protein [Cellulophaga sp. BC115SP]NBB31956.1 hypothetical protein [Cellulophaga sp. BC115SP]
MSKEEFNKTGFHKGDFVILTHKNVNIGITIHEIIDRGNDVVLQTSSQGYLMNFKVSEITKIWR